MTYEGAAVSSIRTKVSTGYGRLDQALHGGFVAGSMVVLNAPAGDEAPLLLRNFLKSEQPSLLICRNLSSAQTIVPDAADGMTQLICTDKPVSPAKGILPGKGIENLTDLNLQVNEADRNRSTPLSYVWLEWCAHTHQNDGPIYVGRTRRYTRFENDER